jgi:hypothetical protein
MYCLHNPTNDGALARLVQVFKTITVRPVLD